MPKFHDGPKVFLVAETKLEYPGILKFLREIGADKYALDVRDNGTDRDGVRYPNELPDSLSEPEDLVRLAGKLCYRSFEPGLNPNVSKVREGRREYVAKSILAQGHGSVLEHSTMSFVFWRVSRVFTHELCRHRTGTAISQESMRYVRLDDMEFWMPGAFSGEGQEGGPTDRQMKAQAMVREAVERLELAQKELGKAFDLDDPAVPFDHKKKVTSAMRRIAPDGVSTSILWTANFRTLRHVILLRTSPAAEEEIRLVFDEVAKICKQRHPAVFSDFNRQADGTWTCDNGQQPYDGKG